MLTYLDLQNRVLRLVDEVENLTTTRDLVKDAINVVHRSVCFAKNWSWIMWPREESFTTVAGQRAYALNPSLGKLRTLWDVSANDFATILPRTQWEASGVDRGSLNRSPSSFIYGSIWPVNPQPTLVGTISAVSDSTLDTVTRGSSIIITGIDDAFIERHETLVLTGTTPKYSVQPFTHIMSVSKAGTISGTVMLKDILHTEIYNVDADEDGRLFPTLEATENPIAGRVFTYTFLRTPRTLVNDGDIPEVFPNDLSEILVYGALLELTGYNTELGPKEQVLWGKQFDRFMSLLVEANAETIVGSAPRTVREIDQRNRVRWVMDN